MSVKLMAMVFDAEFPKYLVYTTRAGRQKRLKRSTAKLVLLAFADHANDDGRGAYPSLDLVAQKTGLSLRAVKSTVLALVCVGLLIPNGRSFRGTNDYIVNKDALARGVVNPVDDRNAQGGEPGTPWGVNPVHLGGEPGAPEPSFNRPFNHPPKGGADAPRAPEAVESSGNEQQDNSSGERSGKRKPPLAVQVYRSRAGRFPRRTLWGMIEAAVGEDDDALGFWGEVVEAWVASGWNPMNIRGMLDYFQRSELPGTRRRRSSDDGGKAISEAQAAAVVQRAREMLDAGDAEGAAHLLAERIFDASVNAPTHVVLEAQKIWREVTA